MSAKSPDPLERLVREFPRLTREELEARWEAWTVDYDKLELHECIGALLARQVTLANQLVQSPSIWNGHISPVLLRCMADAYISLAWIVKDPLERSRRFILHGLGQLKLEIEHRRNQLEDSSNRAVEELAIESLEEWINSQRYTFLTEVELGSWSGKNTRSMAEEAGCLDFYRYVYTPFSAPVHSMWHHIARYNLARCSSALHRYHRIPLDPEMGFDPNYPYLAGKYLDKAYMIFDETFGVEVAARSSLDLLKEVLLELREAASEEQEDSVSEEGE